VPERGLHPQQGAAARGRGDGRGVHLAAAGHRLWRAQVNRQAARPQEKVIGKLTGGLADGQDAQGDHGARLRRLRRRQPPRSGRNHRHGPGETGTKKVIAFKKAIIAAGSQAVRLPFMPDDPRVVDSTGALALQACPSAC
jgi:dihydrolipoamide dehydrogenase